MGLDDEALRRDRKVRYRAREGRPRVIHAARFSGKPGWVYSPK